ncbi:pleurotolysin A [Polyporus arcularius HHB13444]|uniref:Pleurotolysin A n=1 Tax=Polyporus arcularius HHB13444 TaxID=1314778 RepID=A0A5C3PD23_9APHY|nr:pleurotolysin A [Polyporus arcularius HHB13444]
MSKVETASGPPNAYGQWVTMYTKNSGTVDMRIEALYLTWGKLYANGDKDKELSTTQFNGHIIHPGEEVQINACGRENASSGTTGHFDLIDCTNERRIRQFYWDCPWGSSTNTWTVSDSNENWMVETKGANLDGGALGTIYTDCLNKATH